MAPFVTFAAPWHWYRNVSYSVSGVLVQLRLPPLTSKQCNDVLETRVRGLLDSFLLAF